MNLPLIDGCLIIDNSSLEKLQSCPYEWDLSYNKKRINAASRAGLNFGSGCHLALKTRYSTDDNEPCSPDTESIIHIELDKHFTDSPEPVGDYRNFNMATEWLAAYNRMYRKEPFNILKLYDERSFVERSFLRPFALINKSGGLLLNSPPTPTEKWIKNSKEDGFIPVLYSGRIDLGISDNGEWVMDHKSAYMFGKNFQAEMAATPQLRGYCWEFKHYYGRMPKGYIINAFRVRPPVKGAEYDSSLLFRTDGKDPDFIRLPFPVSEQDINEWEQNTFNLIEELIFHANRGTFGKHKKNCVGKYGQCQFYELCNSVAPEHRETYLASNVFMDNNWTALNTPEQKGQQ